MPNKDLITIQIPFEDFIHLDKFEIRCKYFYRIRTEQSEFVPFSLNPAQELLYKIEQEEENRSYNVTGKRHVKYLLLKSRQIGGSTYAAVRNFDKMLTMNATHGLVLAHDDDGTNILWKKYETLWDNYPDVLQVIKDGKIILEKYIRPETMNESGKRLRFSNLTKSDLIARTAGGGDSVGKGDTLNLIHLSEAANFSYYEDIKSSADPQVRSSSQVYYVIESTANGMTGAGEGFYNDWVKSEREWKRFKNGETNRFDGFRPVFIPWYLLNKYKEPLYQDRMIDLEGIDFYPIDKKQFMEREEMLINDMGLSLEQINFYRLMLKTDAQYKLINAYRYYPTFPEEAFQSTSSCFFDSNKLFILKKDFEDGKRETVYTSGFINDDYEFVPSKFGKLKVFKEPEPNYVNRYFVGCDQSKGKEDGDFTAIYVFDKLKNEFSAYYHDNIKENQIAEILYRIGAYYNWAKLIPEANLATVVNTLEPDGLMPYPGPLYIREVSKNGQVWYGFETNQRTRKELLLTYLDWLEPNGLPPRHEAIPDIDSIDEHISFVRKAKGSQTKFEADDKKHDDRVMAMAMAVYGAVTEEEELFTTNETKTDIEKIFDPNTFFIKNQKKHYRLGMRY
jgi:hypothetical protein